MAKTYADWSQDEVTSVKRDRSKVYTRANTNFETWKAMAAVEFAKEGVDFDLPSDLNKLHAWESDNTPYHFAEEWSRRQRRHTSRAKMGPPGVDSVSK